MLACVAVSPREYRAHFHLRVQYYMLLWQLHSDFGDFSDEVRHVMKMAIAESNHYTGLLTQQIFFFSSDVLLESVKCK